MRGILVTKVREIRVSFFAQGDELGTRVNASGSWGTRVGSATPGVALRAECKGGGQRRQLLRRPERAGANDPDSIMQPAEPADTMHSSFPLNRSSARLAQQFRPNQNAICDATSPPILGDGSASPCRFFKLSFRCGTCASMLRPQSNRRPSKPAMKAQGKARMRSHNPQCRPGPMQSRS